MSIELIALAGAVFAAVAALLACRAFSVSLRRYRSRFVEKVGGRLREGFMFIDPARLFAANLVLIAVLGATVWLITAHWIPMALVCCAGFGLPKLTLWWLARLRREKLRQQLPDALLLISGGLRAGGSLSQAIVTMVQEMPAPVGEEFDLYLREQRLGVTMHHALESLERRVPIEEIRLLGAALRIAHETGGNLAETMERLGNALRAKLQIEGKIDALTSQGRLQGWVMVALPIALVFVLFQIDPVAMRPLLTQWYGWLTCVVVVLLEVFGIWMIRRIVAIDV